MDVGGAGYNVEAADLDGGQDFDLATGTIARDPGGKLTVAERLQLLWNEGNRAFSQPRPSRRGPPSSPWPQGSWTGDQGDLFSAERGGPARG